MHQCEILNFSRSELCLNPRGCLDCHLPGYYFTLAIFVLALFLSPQKSKVGPVSSACDLFSFRSGAGPRVALSKVFVSLYLLIHWVKLYWDVWFRFYFKNSFIFCSFYFIISIVRCR